MRPGHLEGLGTDTHSAWLPWSFGSVLKSITAWADCRLAVEMHFEFQTSVVQTDFENLAG